MTGDTNEKDREKYWETHGLRDAIILNYDLTTVNCNDYAAEDAHYVPECDRKQFIKDLDIILKVCMPKIYCVTCTDHTPTKNTPTKNLHILIVVADNEAEAKEIAVMQNYITHAEIDDAEIIEIQRTKKAVYRI